MPNTSKAEAAGPGWSALVDPEETTWSSSPYVTRLVDCGLEWDAIVVAPLRRGLAALTQLGLPVAHGYAVLADYVRQELIVHVRAGTAHQCTAPGTRSLTTGSCLLMPTDQRGSLSATWLSPPHPTRRLVDPGELSDALRQIDQTGAA
uniref:hypothetical protein n=1 Tax=Streptomyces antimycoticus TaxID=68175 RepID=UPI002F90BA07|nr:hypothetical protein OG546_49350 [Streptomyces antimycoticus]